jgi:hypothetical protein
VSVHPFVLSPKLLSELRLYLTLRSALNVVE